MSYLLSSFHTDTHNTISLWKSDRWWRSTVFGKCIESEQGETRLLYISCLTYYLHFIQTLTTMDLRGNNIGDAGAQYWASALQVNRVRLDFSPPHSRLLSSFRTDAHNAVSLWEQHQHWSRGESIHDGCRYWMNHCIVKCAIRSINSAIIRSFWRAPDVV